MTLTALRIDLTLTGSDRVVLEPGIDGRDPPVDKTVVATPLA